MKRRTFLKGIALASGAALLKPTNLFAGEFKTDLSSYSAGSPAYWDYVLSQFSFAKDYCYFNTGGIGACPKPVLDVICKTYIDEQVTPNGSFDHKIWEAMEEKVAKRFGCKPTEVSLTSCATESNNIVLNGIPFEKGDEVITSDFEHVGLIIPLINMHRRKGIVIKTFRPDMEDALNNVKLIESLITPRTKVIFVSHITCANGQLLPGKEICDLAKKHNIICGFDGAQVLGNMTVDLKGMGADFYTASAHKWMLGPKRTGMVYVREDMQSTIQATTVGAYSNTGDTNLNKLEMTLMPSAERYVYGTQGNALIYGLNAALDFCDTIGADNIWNHNKGLAELLVSELLKIEGVNLVSPKQAEYRTPQIAFNITGRDYNKVSSFLTSNKCRVRAIYEGNLNATRISCHLYNNEAHIGRLVELVKKAIADKVGA